MKRLFLLSFLIVGLLATTSVLARSKRVTDADIPRNLPTVDAVSIEWTDPAEFSDIRYSGNRWEAVQGNWVVDLASHLQKRAAKQLAPGQQLKITITDIRRAGMYEPGRGMNFDRIRVIKDIYPPRVTLNFTLEDASGQVIAQGERKLVDGAFLMGASPINDTDTLRYEKRMLDNWLSSEFKVSREV